VCPLSPIFLVSETTLKGKLTAGSVEKALLWLRSAASF